MNNFYGVILNSEGKVYYFNGNDLNLEINQYVFVETERGLQLGKVVKRIDESKIKIPLEELKSILKTATKDDYNVYLDNLVAAEKCLVKARKIAQELSLNMNILDATYK